MDKNWQILRILWSRTKRSKTQYNKGAGKEIILLIYTSTMTRTAHDLSLKFLMGGGVGWGRGVQ